MEKLKMNLFYLVVVDGSVMVVDGSVDGSVVVVDGSVTL